MRKIESRTRQRLIAVILSSVLLALLFIFAIFSGRIAGFELHNTDSGCSYFRIALELPRVVLHRRIPVQHSQ